MAAIQTSVNRLNGALGNSTPRAAAVAAATGLPPLDMLRRGLFETAQGL
jgi:hypothetical protein